VDFGVHGHSMASMQQPNTRRASRSRQDWHRRRTLVAALNDESESGVQVLNFNEAFMRSFGMQHPALRRFVDGACQLLSPASSVDAQRTGHRILQLAWNEYYAAVGDGEEAKSHFTRASVAAGACVSPRMNTAPNCVHFALGARIGAPSTAEDPDGHIPAMLNRALVGFIRTRPDGRNECVMTTVFPELLSDLGFGRAPQPAAGDVVVYTLVKASDATPGVALTEHAVHFGLVVECPPSSTHVMIESKSGYAFATYIHPVDVVDPTYLIEAPIMRTHYFRPLRPPLATSELALVAHRYEARVMSMARGDG